MAAARCAIAGLALLLFSPRCVFDLVARSTRGQLASLAVAGALLAAHLGFFLTGLSKTSLPAAVTLVSLEPLAVILTAWLLSSCRPRRKEWIGIGVAIAGALLITGSDASANRLSGDLLVLTSVLLWGLYLAAVRALGLPSRPTAIGALLFSCAALLLGGQRSAGARASSCPSKRRWPSWPSASSPRSAGTCWCSGRRRT